MDQLMVANTVNNEVDEEDISGSNDKEKNEVLETTYSEDYHDGFGGGRRSHRTGNTKVTNGFQQCEHHTQKIWFC
jgi:hypothetical protein